MVVNSANSFTLEELKNVANDWFKYCARKIVLLFLILFLILFFVFACLAMKNSEAIATFSIFTYIATISLFVIWALKLYKTILFIKYLYYYSRSSTDVQVHGKTNFLIVLLVLFAFASHLPVWSLVFYLFFRYKFLSFFKFLGGDIEGLMVIAEALKKEKDIV